MWDFYRLQMTLISCYQYNYESSTVHTVRYFHISFTFTVCITYGRVTEHFRQKT